MTLENSEFTQPSGHYTARDIETWLVTYLAALLNVDSDEVDVTLPFASYGLDSATTTELIRVLQERLGCEFNPTLPYNYPTIATLSRYLAEVSQ